MYSVYRWTPLLARILMALIFIVSGFGKLMDPSATAAQTAAHGIPMAYAAGLAAGIVELGGGLALLFGCGTRAAALLLALYLIPVTYLFHNPAGTIGAAHHMQQIQLMKNLAIMGGLLQFFAFGAGPASVDVGLRRPRGFFGSLFGERPLMA